MRRAACGVTPPTCDQPADMASWQRTAASWQRHSSTARWTLGAGSLHALKRRAPAVSPRVAAAPPSAHAQGGVLKLGCSCAGCVLTVQVAGYERKGRALLGLAEAGAALAAFERSLRTLRASPYPPYTPLSRRYSPSHTFTLSLHPATHPAASHTLTRFTP